MAFKVVPSRKDIEQFIERFVERKLKESRVEERINELRRVLGLDKKGGAKAVVAVAPTPTPAPAPAPAPARVELKHEAVPAPRAEPRREAPPVPEPKPSAPKATTFPPPAKKKAAARKAAKKPAGPVKVPAPPAKAPATKAPAAKAPAAKAPAAVGPDPLEVVLAALDAHPKKAALIKAGKQKDQLLRSLIPLYVAQKLDVEVTSGVASKLWARHGVTFAAPNAAKVLREHAGYAKRNAKGVQITPAGVKYVEDALAGSK
jgi:hypothetical protein